MEGEELLPAHCLRDSCRGTRSSHRTPRAGVWDGQGDGGGNCTLIKVIVRRPQPKEAKGCGIDLGIKKQRQQHAHPRRRMKRRPRAEPLGPINTKLGQMAVKEPWW